MKQAAKIRRERRNSVDYYIFKKGRIAREKELGIWHRDGDNVYIRCLGCFNILKIDWDDILPSGRIADCIVCEDEDAAVSGCGMHQWVIFKGFWDKEPSKKGN
jgi:hypothetical protein